MASTTPNIGLTLPTGTEGWKRSVINGNFTILDTKIGAVGNTSLQSQINTLSSQLAGFDGKRMIATNRSSIAQVVEAVTATANNSISIVGVTSGVCTTLGGGNDSGIVFCKYFANDNIINYAVFGRTIAIGKINTTNNTVTVGRKLSTSLGTGFTTRSALETALSDFNATLVDGDVANISFTCVSGMESPFTNAGYGGVFYRSSSTRARVILLRSGYYSTMTGYLGNSGWVWYEVNQTAL